MRRREPLQDFTDSSQVIFNTPFIACISLSPGGRERGPGAEPRPESPLAYSASHVPKSPLPEGRERGA
jgi:hypothetical protein